MGLNYNRRIEWWGKIFFGMLIIVQIVESNKFTLDKLTPWQLGTIEELRRQVQDELPYKYMDDDLYYARWLSSKKWHVDEAIVAMRENFKWRKQNYMDTVLKEDWREMDEEFPYQLDTVDRQGRPLLYIKMGEWNVGRMSNMLRLHMLSRHFAKIFEEADVRVRRTRARGRDISQITVLVNMEGYSMMKHACFHCFSFYTGLGRTLQTRYPRVAERVVFINSPPLFTVVFDSLQRMLNIEDEQSMELFGTDRNRWESVITEYLDRSQFPRDLKE